MKNGRGGSLGGTPRGGPKGPYDDLNMDDLGWGGGRSYEASIWECELGCNKGSSWYVISGASSTT